MLTWLQLRNFKPICGEVTLPITPVTLLCGLNSSGKSSVLQSIRLLSQTLANQVKTNKLVLNGFAIQAGSFSTILNDRANEQLIAIGFGLEIDRRPTARPIVRYRRPPWDFLGLQNLTIDCVATFEGLPAGTEEGVYEPRVDLRETRLGIETVVDRRSRLRRSSSVDLTSAEPETVRVEVDVVQLSEGDYDRMLEDISPRSQFYFGRDDQRFKAIIRSEDTKALSDSCFPRLSHFLPSTILRRFDVAERNRLSAEIRIAELLRAYREDGNDSLDPRAVQSTRIEPLRSRMAGERLIELLDSVGGLPKTTASTPLPELAVGDVLKRGFEALPDDQKSVFENEVRQILISELIEEAPRSTGYDLEPLTVAPATDILDEGVQEITSFFSRRVRYLGPLREEPRTAQGYSPSNEPDDVGARGEYAAAVFTANHRRPIRWWNPVSENEEIGDLRQAVDFWINYLGVAHHVDAQTAPHLGVSWLVQHRQGSPARGLQGVGVGVSQVLPVLVAGLIAEEGTLLLIEQPELHLHPRAQSKLADFFYSLTKMGKQCIVETHSESLIGKMRLLLVRDAEAMSRIVSIYFVQQTEDGDASFRTVQISANGNILNWPTGFFDETHLLEEQIALEAMRKKRGRDLRG